MRDLRVAVTATIACGSSGDNFRNPHPNLKSELRGEDMMGVFRFNRFLKEVEPFKLTQKFIKHYRISYSIYRIVWYANYIVWYPSCCNTWLQYLTKRLSVIVHRTMCIVYRMIHIAHHTISITMVACAIFQHLMRAQNCLIPLYLYSCITLKSITDIWMNLLPLVMYCLNAINAFIFPCKWITMKSNKPIVMQLLVIILSQRMYSVHLSFFSCQPHYSWNSLWHYSYFYVFSMHWSLVIICIPAKEDESGPIILHLDSLGIHSSNEILEVVSW